MKVPGKSQSPATFPALNPTHYSDLKNLSTTNNNLIKPVRRRTQNPSLTRNGAPVGRRSRSRPETPLLKWKVEDKMRSKNVAAPAEEEEEEDEEEGEVVDSGRRRRRKSRRKSTTAVSSRKLAAGLWRVHQPETVEGGGGDGERRKDRLGFQPGAGHVGIPFLFECNGKSYGSEAKDLLQSRTPLNGTNNGFFRKIEPSMQFPNSAMEGATKWDPINFNPTDEVHRIYSHMKRIDQQVSAVSMVTALETELEQARARVKELETERRTSKKKLEHFLRKVSEERSAWRSREHEKIRAVIDDIKTELNRERKNRQRTEIINSKLVNDLADAKLTAKRFMQDYDKERKARELIEEVCDELAKEIGDDKAEVEALKRDSMKLRDEVDEERKMLQMAEVWREERVQMKLVDAKVALDEKYSQMSFLVAELEKILRSTSVNSNIEDTRKAEILQMAAADIDVEEVKEFSYEPPNSDDIYAVFEEMNFGEPNEREIEPCSKVHTVSPEINMKKNNIHKNSNVYIDEDGEIDDDESGWETVSHVEDQGSSYSPEGSAPSVSKNCRNSNVSGSGTEWEERGCEETPITEISEVCSVPRQKKKGSSIARLWRSVPNNGENYKIVSLDGSNGRLSNGRLSTNTGISSPDREGLSPDLMGQWSSPDSANPHITRAMKGCIEWPRGAQKNSLKSKLLEARMESNKVQLRHVLKHKI